MKKIAIIAGAVLVVLIALVLIVPALIDWNSYKGEITARLEQALGRKVTIAGDLSMSLLPSPALSAHDVSLANIPGAEPPQMATVEALKVRIGLLPLLTGRVAVRSLVLEQPVVHLQKLADGRANWDFQKAEPAAAQSPAAPQGGKEAPEGAKSRAEIGLGAVIIENGTVIYHPAKGAETRLERIGLKLSGDSLDGPYSLDGDLLWQGTEVRLDGSTGALTQDKAPAALTLRLPKADAELRFSGLIGNEGGERVLRGKLGVTGGSVRQLVADLAGAQGLPAGLNQDFALNGALTASGGQAALNDMTLRLGKTEAGGGISVAYAGAPQADIVLSFNRLALDEWVKGGTGQGEVRGPLPPAATGKPADKAAPQTAQPAAETNFSLPDGIGVSLDISADAVTLDQRSLRQVKLNAALADGEITINQAHMELPGNSDFTLFGTLAARGGKPVLDGKIEAASDNLRALLDWAAVDVSSVPADRLRQFNATGQLQGSPEEFQLADVDLRLDTLRLNGAATVRLGGRPAFGVTLVGDNLNLDGYLPKAGQSPAAPPAGQAQPKAKEAAPRQAQGGGLDGLRSFDANLKARIAQVTAGGMTARDVAVDATLLAGELTLRDTGFADLAGASARLNGKIGAGDKGWTLTDLGYDLRSRQPGKTLRAFGLAPPPETDQLGALALTGTLNGTAEALTLTSRNEVAGASLALNGTVRQPLVAPQYDLAVEGNHASLTQLIRIFAADYRPAGNLGAFTLTGRLRGDGRAIDLSDLRSRLGPVTAMGDISVDLGARPLVTAHLTTNDLPVAMFLPAKRAASAPVRQGDAGGGASLLVPAAYRKIADEAPPVQAAPRQGVRSEDIDSRSAWSRDPIDLSALKGFDAKVQLASQALIYEKYRLDGAQLDFAVADGAAMVNKLTGKLWGGDLAFTGKLAGGGTPAANGKLTVSQANIREATLGFGKIEISEGLLDAAATLQANGRTMDEMIGRLNGEGTINGRNGAISGFDLKEVSRRLGNIDNVGNLLQLLQAGLSGGSTRFSSLTGSFKAQNGVVTSNDVLLQAEAGEGRGEIALNLPRYVMDAVLRFRLTEHGNAPPLGIRLEGPIDNPKRVFDINDIQSWLVGKGMGRMLKGGKGAEGQILQGLFGKPQQPSQPQAQPPADQAAPPPPPSDQPPPKPEKVLRDTLKGLIR